METISIITPTRNREKFLRNLEPMVRAQTRARVEWIIWDDSPAPSPHFSSLSDPNIKYVHSSAALSIGEIRNRMVGMVQGGIIAHFDDDDYYGEKYLETMSRQIDEGYDFVKLCGWSIYSGVYRALGYWDCRRVPGHHFIWSNQPQSTACFDERDAELKNIYFGYGFSYN